LPQTSTPIILDGLYQMDEKNMDKDQDWKLKSIYWKDDDDTNLLVRRGMWFSTENGQPLSLSLSTSIESQHLKFFKDQIIPESSVYNESEVSKKPGM
jgi:hypothetical protein